MEFYESQDLVSTSPVDTQVSQLFHSFGGPGLFPAHAALFSHGTKARHQMSEQASATEKIPMDWLQGRSTGNLIVWDLNMG